MSSFFTEIVFFTEIQISQHRSHIFHFVKTATRAVTNAVRNAVKNAREKIYVLKPGVFLYFLRKLRYDVHTNDIFRLPDVCERIRKVHGGVLSARYVPIKNVKSV